MRYLQPIQAKGGAMSRQPRSKSPTGYFHVTLRGNGGQILFEDDDDRIAMLQILDAILPKHEIELVAWCLMGNHIHLLINDPDDHMSEAMHAVAVSFAGRFNARTGHIGHVFQERFWDSPIKSEEYLLEAIRYIHLNPQKAGLAAYDDYPWSSHREYLMGRRFRPHVTDNVVDALFPTPRSYLQFMESAPSLPYRPSATAKVAEEDLSEFGGAIVRNIAGCAPAELKSVSKALRNEAILALRKEGLTIKQVQLLTGLGTWIIKNAA